MAFFLHSDDGARNAGGGITRYAAGPEIDEIDGVFYRFCQKAILSPSRRHVFIIDEINRGNLSKILGELMLLIEDDKRGPGWAASLTYARPTDPRFFIPENVYLLGMMNTADRSLSIVDYALRRRSGTGLARDRNRASQPLDSCAIAASVPSEPMTSTITPSKPITSSPLASTSHALARTLQ